MHWRRKWQPTPVFLPGESQGQEPGGLPSMGRTESDTTEVTAAAAAAAMCSHLIKSNRPLIWGMGLFRYKETNRKTLKTQA